MQNNIQYTQTDSSNNQDLNKHIESLRTRLGFAKFKLHNGWESNTLCDVECLWKQKQKKLIRDIPVPRFTQQNIIDKRTYIQSCHKFKRSKLLTRSLSSPVGEEEKKIIRRQSHPISHHPPALIDSPPKEPIKNSLDFLSYAIAMTEKEEKEKQDDWKRTSQLRLSLSIPNLLVEDKSPEISPSSVTAAAHAMMLFMNNNRS
ncbi:unnamed protein product [Rhizopus stolonifer]